MIMVVQVTQQQMYGEDITVIKLTSVVGLSQVFINLSKSSIGMTVTLTGDETATNYISGVVTAAEGIYRTWI